MVWIVIILILGGYLYFQYRLRQLHNKHSFENYDTSVASYQVSIRPGEFTVKLLSIGKQENSVLKIVQRYNPLLSETEITNLIDSKYVLTSVSIYTAEDMVAELVEIGADAQVINNVQ